MTIAVSPTSYGRQQGIVLVTGLLILVLMTIIGVTALRSTMLEEKMAGNLKDQNVAFQSAEAALRAGENYLRGGGLGVFLSDTAADNLVLNPSGLYAPTLTAAHQRWEQANIWTDAGSLTYPRDPGNLNTATVTLEGTAAPPRYIIEDISKALQCVDQNNCVVAPLPSATAGEDLTHQSYIEATGYYRITARGVGTSPNTVVYLQSYYYP